ncbi:MAG: transketolase, partial [Actinomycetota bacterium]|nr:transketolase [Actinomycetota bacterium]
LDVLEGALRRAMAVEDQPSLVVLRSHIGHPSPKWTDTKEAHGSPFGEDEVAVTKEILGLPPGETFWVPDDVVSMYRKCGSRGRALSAEWHSRLAVWDGDRAELDACLAGRGLPGWEAKLPTWEVGDKLATRKASGAVLDAIVDVVPGILSGGADLTGNTNTTLKDGGVQTAAEPGGRQIYFGIREHGMGAAMNGMAMHGGVLPVGGTFFVFSDYMRPSVRLASISGAHVVYAWTHDSVGLGEDGPTHQPIEHLASLRAIPGLRLLRPADANETAQAWRVAVGVDGPVGLVLSRQDLPVLDGTAGNEGVLRGAYVLAEVGGSGGKGAPDLVLIGTGSEVHVCVDAAALLAEGGMSVRVVSMPSWELFEEQDEAYRRSVLPGGVPTLAVEAGASLGWDRYANDVVALDRFGASAPGRVALEKLGYNPDNVAGRARRLLVPTS